ncbi:hypothetical protein P3W85_19810 [Cupriavidus basilensis]|uniref:Uncharacterized protein n=1 Tax=Cupriavidus basilensis TaxID=68895 RepID=A0ABT6ARE2_9BURK|nr:hypothetical protein [Cupriavidus basilensis]MDF3835191.1 hypothetical protein [Cupriavidus basilensis]
MISGIAVPPPPADREVNATSAGIDKNGNGVRDDVERLLATAYGADAKAFAGAMKMAARMQTILAPTSIDRDTVQAIVVAGVNDARCNTDANFKGNLLAASRANQVVMAAALNTVERVALYQARLSLASAVVPIDVQKACS